MSEQTFSISSLNLNMLVVFVCLLQAYTDPAGRASRLRIKGMFMSYGVGRKHVSILIIITESQRACRSVSRLPSFPTSDIAITNLQEEELNLAN